MLPGFRNTSPRAEDRVVTPPQAALRAPAQQPSRPGPAGVPQRTIQPSSNATRNDDLMNVIRQLSDVLTKENTALKRHKIEDVKILGERKEQLARVYQQHMNAIHRDPGAVKAWDPAKRSALAQASIRMSELMKENASLLKANITTINKFLKTVTEAVRDKQEKESASYTKQGALNGYAVVKRKLAMSYNQTM
jgi:translation initiation factor 2 beta subunit (eIF-2beta)/eIF-5